MKMCCATNTVRVDDPDGHVAHSVKDGGRYGA